MVKPRARESKMSGEVPEEYRFAKGSGSARGRGGEANWK